MSQPATLVYSNLKKELMGYVNNDVVNATQVSVTVTRNCKALHIEPIVDVYYCEIDIDVSVILGRPFLAIGKAFVDVEGRCVESNLILNWEKCHFMGKEGIVLGPKISGKGIEVAIPLCRLLEKESASELDDACLKAFVSLKEKIVSSHIIISVGGSLPFEMMCGASGFALSVVLGWRKNKYLHPI
ncbi:hypothetical protein MTR67_002896 [Solanum verrucosum]|uniref:Uncharacterized protein n=1 Tax=Solanum verrucosum TaxID=315347 RepID=A0AAF0PRP7_SOLVR|nr:hypothetical protein MTR67_002896 [Solanum verrucosum]